MSREAMKLALEAMERYQVKRQDFDRFADEITALQKALANEALDRKAENARELGLDYEPAQQKPVAWISKHGVVYPFDAKDEVHPINDLQPLYTSPPAQRPWVGLTDEEAFQICVDCGCLSEDWLTLLDAIEAKLKEKNT